MRIAMLGPLDVRDDTGTAFDVSGVRLRRLVIALALDAGRVVSASRLVDAVWADDPPAEPANALQALVSRLRRAVPGVVVAHHPTGYRLDVADVDTARFERLANAGRTQLTSSPIEAAGTLRTALALWRGPALAEMDDDFARAPRARLNEIRLVALSDRIDADLRTGGPPRSLVPELEGLVAEYPLRERFAVLLMRALDASGDRPGALLAFERSKERLADALGVAPSATLTAEHVKILRADDKNDDRADDKGDDSTGEAAAPLTNLHSSLTGFVGREQDIVEIDALLTGSRLTTLLGPGGSGKTRLAVEAAHGRAAMSESGDGVWMAEFAPIGDPADLAPAVLAAVGVRDSALVRTSTGASTTTSTERLVASLARKRALLVFDNCEHVIAEAAQLAHTVLARCPEIRILATSREPLGVPGEALWPVEPLPLPPAGDVPVEELTGYASVRLLVQRAAAVRPGFAVTGANAAAVARICRALDGMPLAIELAAARLRTMSPEQLAGRLDERFELLTGGARTVLPRHQTLRAVVDWSWDLLDDAERTLWSRLSVFSGGATPDAIAEVCGGGSEVLGALVDKSVVTVRDEGTGPRYELLETIRAYGSVRLDEAGEVSSTRRAHAAYFMRLAGAAQYRLLGRDQLDWLARLADDHENLNAAIRGATATGDPETALRLVASLGWYWWLRGHRREGVELIAAAVAMPLPIDRSTAFDEQLGSAYAIGGLLAVDSTDQVALAMRWFGNAADIAERIGRPTAPLLRLVAPYRAATAMFEAQRMDRFIELPIPVDDPDPWIGATSRVMRAHVMINFGRSLADAEADFATARATFESLGERWGIAFSINSLAMLIGWRGDFQKAAELQEQALRSVTELGVGEDQVMFRRDHVRLLWRAGDRAAARRSLRLMLRDAHRLGVPSALAAAEHVAGDIARLEGDPRTAGEHLERAAALARGMPIADQFRALIASSRGMLAGAVGDLDGARRHHQDALALVLPTMDAPIIASVLIGYADVLARSGDATGAAYLLGASVGVRGTVDRTVPDVDRITDDAAAALGDTAFTEAYERGRRAELTEISAMLTGG